MSVVVVGSINVDLQLRVSRHPTPGETLLAAGGTYSAGGKGANQACAAALAGARVTLLGAVGSDDASRTALALLSDAGVLLDHVATMDSPTGLAVVTVDSAGENTVLVVSGANALVAPAQVDAWAGAIGQAEVVICQGELSASTTAAVARQVRGRWVLNLAPVIDLDPAVTRLADPLVVNQHEAALVLTQLGGRSDGSPESLVTALRDQGIASVVLTLGADGALVADATGLSQIRSPKVQAVDTVGAGDAFVGALAARLSDGRSLGESAAYAARFAAYTVQYPGAQASYPPAGTHLPEIQ